MTDLQDDLDAFVVGDAFEHDSSIDYDTPGDLDAVNRLLRLRGFLERKVDETRDLAARNIEQIAEWRDDRLSTYGGRLVDVDRALEGFARAQFEIDPRRKTHKLPAGTLSLRAAPERVTIDDPHAVAQWAIGASLEAQLVEWVPKIAAKEIKKLVVPGPAVGEPDDAGYVPRVAFWLSPDVASGCLVVALISGGLTFTYADLFVTFAEVVPTVTLLVPTRPSFSASTGSKRASAYDENEPREREGVQ